VAPEGRVQLVGKKIWKGELVCFAAGRGEKGGGLAGSGERKGLKRREEGSGRVLSRESEGGGGKGGGPFSSRRLKRKK